MEPLRLILDTDIGPDVDDAGALALLHLLARETPTEILAITHCASNPYGCGCIDAICRAYGHENIPIGTFESPGFLDDENAKRYNKAVCESYPNRFNESPPPGAGEVLQAALSAAPDKSVTLITIGPLNNLARFAARPGGAALLGRKIKNAVCMAGGLLSPEWNIEMDIPAAKAFFKAMEELRIPVLLSPYETGIRVITGQSFGKMSPSHPVRAAYALHSPDGRPSWDLTAVWAAIKGEEPFFFRSEPGFVLVEDDGYISFTPSADGNAAYLFNRVRPEVIASALDRMWED